MILICEDQESEGARACPGYAPGRMWGQVTADIESRPLPLKGVRAGVRVIEVCRCVIESCPFGRV